MINLTATFHAKAGQEQQLESLLVAMLAPTRQEPGNTRYCLFKDKENAAIFTFQEQFSDQAAFDEHCKQPHFTQLLASLDGLLEQEPKITFLEELSA
ncbi:putative quinol monooxygenase [Vibrio atypicus]|jgi:quinol monooxygenase YgiN|uniref:putative quinol monooxygenase n=1 Tax=Vibrio atypicus TaxID=558271 RepID=UPI00135BA113|nr:putative quinol monooxygenase [Vibrio atypicus]